MEIRSCHFSNYVKKEKGRNEGRDEETERGWKNERRSPWTYCQGLEAWLLKLFLLAMILFPPFRVQPALSHIFRLHWNITNSKKFDQLSYLKWFPHYIIIYFTPVWFPSECEQYLSIFCIFLYLCFFYVSPISCKLYSKGPCLSYWSF